MQSFLHIQEKYNYTGNVNTAKTMRISCHEMKTPTVKTHSATLYNK